MTFSLSSIISFCSDIYNRVLDAFLTFSIFRYQYLLIIVALAAYFIADFIRKNRS